ncbi:MAG: hypothetical protein U1E42_04445 [Rhodospirillales bacterium]
MESPADDGDVLAARREVDRLAAASTASPAELASARLALSRALDEADRPSDAMGAARAGIEALAPAFGAGPQALAEPMRALVSQYVAVARRTDQSPDRVLLTPIATALGGVVAGEDAAEAEDGDDDFDRR